MGEINAENALSTFPKAEVDLLANEFKLLAIFETGPENLLTAVKMVGIVNAADIYYFFLVEADMLFFISSFISTTSSYQ